ncbi:MAG: IS200/IS605 family transposase [Bacteroidota bacterium]
MANTYTQIHIHAVFAVKYRAAVLEKAWRADVFKYMTGIVRAYDHKMLQINGVEDHVHLLFGMRPTQSLSDLMQNVKRDSSKWINERGLVKGHFQWQGGFGAFSYSKSQVPTVATYIERQEAHHKKETFKKEYETILTNFDVNYDESYTFQELI